MGEMLPNLVNVQFRDNNLTGPILPSISNCSKIEILEMYNNSFTGKLTLDFAILRDIYYISFSYNFLGNEETDNMRFISSLGNCTKLKILALDNCKFRGELPGSIGNLSINLRHLRM